MTDNQMGFGLAALVCLLPLCGCFTVDYRAGTYPARKSFSDSDYQDALGRFDNWAARGRKDRLVHLMDGGLVAHTAGDPEGSNERLMEARGIIDEFERRAVISVRDIGAATASLVINEWMLPYKGEHFERVLVHFYIALNHLSMGDTDSAFVEGKKAYERQKWMEAGTEGARDQMCAVVTYLFALVLEGSGDYNNAAVQYRNVAAMRGGCSQAKEDAIACYARLGRGSDEYLTRVAPDLLALSADRIEDARRRSRMGEVIVLFQCGLAPTKKGKGMYVPIDPPAMITGPAHELAENPIVRAVVSVGEASRSTDVLDDIEGISIATLEAVTGKLLVKEAARIAIKRRAQKKARHQNGLLGFVVDVAAIISQQPDLRCWNTLPASFQVARITVEPGPVEVDISFLGNNGETVNSAVINGGDIRAGEKAIIIVRTTGTNVTLVKGGGV